MLGEQNTILPPAIPQKPSLEGIKIVIWDAAQKAI